MQPSMDGWRAVHYFKLRPLLPGTDLWEGWLSPRRMGLDRMRAEELARERESSFRAGSNGYPLVHFRGFVCWPTEVPG